MKYVYWSNDLKWADMVLIATGRQLAYKGSGRNFPVKGVTLLGGACSVSKVAFVSDEDNLGSSSTAAHEISHALGAAEDGEGANANCPLSDRHIMTPLHPNSKLTYSRCSLASINAFLRKPEAICLFGRSRSALDENPLLMQQRREACQSCLSQCQYIESIATKKPCYFRCTISNKNKEGAKIEYYQYDRDGTPCSNTDPYKEAYHEEQYVHTRWCSYRQRPEKKTLKRYS
ncbi:A disintegrin and metalloproteinase with thrombospondin motifs like [Dermacentor variabilis]|uniref:A disintegrin and metalloproteinase with thrombospondin motifs like n=1 Tax=Dermacentor variabilis TaxID=34621 RepID=UPI003F5B9C31